MNQVRVRTRFGDGLEQIWAIRYTEEAPWTVEVIPPEEEPLLGHGEDLFSALQEVRRQLDPQQILLCCNGSRANARPSRMASEHGAEFIYLVPKGRPASIRDLVPLFAPAPQETAVTVREQQETWHRIASSRLNWMWPINPAWWWQRMREAIEGPVVWIPEADSDGFTTWQPARKRGRMRG